MICCQPHCYPPPEIVESPNDVKAVDNSPELLLQHAFAIPNQNDPAGALRTIYFLGTLLYEIELSV